jgi:hypothetical protein
VSQAAQCVPISGILTIISGRLTYHCYSQFNYEFISEFPLELQYKSVNLLEVYFVTVATSESEHIEDILLKHPLAVVFAVHLPQDAHTFEVIFMLL